MPPGPTVTLEPMTADRFRSWVNELVTNYAHDKTVSGEWPCDAAEAMARRELEQLLPNGVATPDHGLFTGHHDGDEIGVLWLYLSHTRGDCFIYDIEVAAEHRGRGLGRALLEAAEEWSRDHRQRTMSLHVFGHNQTARALYESAGYRITDLTMRKDLVE